MAPQPPVIITTQDDAPLGNTRPSPPTLNIPIGTTSTPPRGSQDPSHLSPAGHLHANGSPSPSYNSGLTPPSPTLTNSSSVHFSEELSSPTSPIPNSTLALRDNHPTAEHGMETLQVVKEGDSPTRHARGSSIATWNSDAGTEVTAVKSKDYKGHELTPESTRKSWKVWRKDQPDVETVAEGGKKKKEKMEEMAHLDPDKDTTDPTPFREKPSRLAMLVDPKSLEDLTKIGGIKGLLQGLGVDGNKGLTVGSDSAVATQAGAPRSSDEVDRRDGPQWTASMDVRRKVYGKNDLPIRPSKSLLYLMWLAFKDAVLVSSATTSRVLSLF